MKKAPKLKKIKLTQAERLQLKATKTKTSSLSAIKSENLSAHNGSPITPSINSSYLRTIPHALLPNMEYRTSAPPVCIIYGDMAGLLLKKLIKRYTNVDINKVSMVNATNIDVSADPPISTTKDTQFTSNSISSPITCRITRVNRLTFYVAQSHLNDMIDTSKVGDIVILTIIVNINTKEELSISLVEYICLLKSNGFPKVCVYLHCEGYDSICDTAEIENINPPSLEGLSENNNSVRAVSYLATSTVSSKNRHGGIATTSNNRIHKKVPEENAKFIKLKADKIIKKLKSRLQEELFDGVKFFTNLDYNYLNKLVRYLGDLKVRPIEFKCSNPYIIIDNYTIKNADTTDCSVNQVRNNNQGDNNNSIYLSGYLRGASIKKQGEVHLPGIGDVKYMIENILEDPCPLSCDSKKGGKLLDGKKRLLYAPLNMSINTIRDDSTASNIPPRKTPVGIQDKNGSLSGGESSETEYTEEDIGSSDTEHNTNLSDSDRKHGSEDSQRETTLSDTRRETGSLSRCKSTYSPKSRLGENSIISQQKSVSSVIHQECVSLETETSSKQEYITEVLPGNYVKIELYPLTLNSTGLSETKPCLIASITPEYFIERLKSSILLLGFPTVKPLSSCSGFNTSKHERKKTENIEDINEDEWLSEFNIEKTRAEHAESNYTDISKHKTKKAHQTMKCIRNRFFHKLIKSTDPIILSVGWRRLQIIPTYFLKDSTSDPARYLKVAPLNYHFFGTFFSPILAPGINCTLLRLDSSFRIAGSGKVVPSETEITKKLRLIGYPREIHNNTAIIKDMFGSNLEVAKFVGSKVQTVSKIRGVIKKEIGKKGDFRCKFEGQIRQDDIVFLSCNVGVTVVDEFINFNSNTSVENRSNINTLTMNNSTNDANIYTENDTQNNQLLRLRKDVYLESETHRPETEYRTERFKDYKPKAKINTDIIDYRRLKVQKSLAKSLPFDVKLQLKDMRVNKSNITQNIKNYKIPGTDTFRGQLIKSLDILSPEEKVEKIKQDRKEKNEFINNQKIKQNQELKEFLEERNRIKKEGILKQNKNKTKRKY
ncbi:Ribosome biogenesis protein bms1 [Cucumispora dikerogammari]|nr:Ribosome biogenesis protein bms1 [Cucumispora dikerogammari]